MTSVRSSEMPWSERHVELYLLASPMNKLIGCFPLVMRIAAAQMNSSVEELRNDLDRLEKLGVAVYRDGWAPVRTWFHHISWRATLQGRVSKAVSGKLAKVPSRHPQVGRSTAPPEPASGARLTTMGPCGSRASPR